MSKILIKQSNIKIKINPTFDVKEFKEDELSRYVLFYYDKNVNRNRYDVKSIKKTHPRTLEMMTESTYRGEVTIEGYGNLPLFVLGFDYPLYAVELYYQHTSSTNQWYSYIKSPLSFKLKNKEDRLCYDVVVYEYNDLTDLANNKWRSKKHIKAKKIEIESEEN